MYSNALHYIRANKVVFVIVLVLIGGAVATLLVAGTSTKTATAYFDEAKNIYPGDEIRVLGIKVGEVSSVKAVGNQVQVQFDYDSKYQIPANVKAAIMSPTLVATRFIQLDPPYSGQGPTLANHAVIPRNRTVEPIEFDDLKLSLSQLADALGPHGANDHGALNRALNVIAANGRPDGVGQGQNFHDMIVSLSKAAATLSNGRTDLFGTIQNLSILSVGLSQFDNQIVSFDQHLDSVSNDLDSNSEQLKQLLPSIDAATRDVDRFLNDHGGQLTTAVARAASISRALAEERGNLAQVLHIGPNTLTDFTNIFDPRTGELHGAFTTNNTPMMGGPGDTICSLMTSVAAANQQQGQQMCVRYLGPVFAHLASEAPPIGLEPTQVPYGITPPNGDIEQNSRQADSDPSRYGSNSDLPRSTTAEDGNGRSGENRGLLPEGLGGK